MLRALKGYQALQVTMLLVVNHLLVKAADFLAIDFDMNQFLNALQQKRYNFTMDWQIHTLLCAVMNQSISHAIIINTIACYQYSKNYVF